MTQPLTQENLKEELKSFGREIGREIKSEIREELHDALSRNTQEIIGHFNKSQVIQNEQLGEIKQQLGEMKGQLETIGEDVGKVKLAVLDLMATDRHLHNLVRELQRNGIALNTEKIFAT